MSSREDRLGRAAERFRSEMEGLGVGVSMQVAGGPMVEVVPAPERKEEAAMAVMQQNTQLSLDVNHDVGDFIVGALSIGGTFPIGRDLQVDERLRVKIVNEQGEVVCEKPVKVVDLGFPRKEKGTMRWTERVHKAKVWDG